MPPESASNAASKATAASDLERFGSEFEHRVSEAAMTSKSAIVRTGRLRIVETYHGGSAGHPERPG
jgi:hypothetical protein